LRKALKYDAFAFELCTENCSDFHSLPPDPLDPDRSRTSNPHCPTIEGDDMETMGFEG
jgi:hypothetical protein